MPRHLLSKKILRKLQNARQKHLENSSNVHAACTPMTVQEAMAPWREDQLGGLHEPGAMRKIHKLLPMVTSETQDDADNGNLMNNEDAYSIQDNIAMAKGQRPVLPMEGRLVRPQWSQILWTKRRPSPKHGSVDPNDGFMDGQKRKI